MAAHFVILQDDERAVKLCAPHGLEGQADDEVALATAVLLSRILTLPLPHGFRRGCDGGYGDEAAEDAEHCTELVRYREKG